ncbi:Hydantoin utilization protein C [Galdieria sulphuraria]|nr:Hydantoin utilization protein C [Galdieria sulphuraria]
MLSWWLGFVLCCILPWVTTTEPNCPFASGFEEPEICLEFLMNKFSNLKQVIDSIGENLLERINVLGSISQETNNRVLNRPFLSSANKRAAKYIEKLLYEAGCSNVAIDWVGNVIGLYKGTPERNKTLIIGSHYDTVKDAGKYDGAYGVLVAISVVEALFKLKVVLPFDIQIVAFENEEGNNNFGVVHTGALFYMAGSMAKRNGTRRKCYHMLKKQLRRPNIINPKETLADYILAQSMDNNVFSLSEDNCNTIIKYFCEDYPFAVDHRVLGYWEWHIEQGPILEHFNKRIGIVSAICGQQRWTFHVKGQGGHAGTVPMYLRKDAVAACVEMIQQVENITKNALSGKNDSQYLVSTVGNISVSPGSSNSIPHLCSFSLDIRSVSDQQGSNVTNQIMQRFKEIAKQRKVKVSYEQLHNTKTIEMESGWSQQIIQRGAYLSIQFYTDQKWFSWLRQKFDKLWLFRSDVLIPTLVSGAGHDAVILHDLYDTQMMFIRCKNGISHHPNELASKEDMLAGATTLLFSLMIFANFSS